MHTCIHSGYFYSASSSPLLLRGAPYSTRILCRNFTPKHHRHLRVKDLPKIPTWQVERESNPWPFGRKASTLPMRHTRPKRRHLHTHMHKYLFTNYSIHKCHTCTHTCSHTYLIRSYVYMQTHIHACMHTYTRTCMRTCIHAYIHTHMHTYIHTKCLC